MGLESSGYVIDSANNGSEFLQRLSVETPEFLITNIDMPGMDGKELVFTIERQFPERRFPIVVLTSHTEGERRDWTRNFRNLHLMEKPISIGRLLAHIKERLG